MNPTRLSDDRPGTGLSVLSPQSSVLSKAAGEVIRYFQELHGAAEGGGEALPYRLTASGAWAASRPGYLFNFFKKINLSSFGLFVDLGSGDGVVCCVASLFTTAVGIESDPFLISRAAQAARELKLEGRAGFIRADFLTQRIQAADCLFIYPDKPIYPLERALNGWGGTLLISGPHFPPKQFSLKEKLKCDTETLSVYVGSREARSVKREA